MKKLALQRRLAAQTLKVGKVRITFDPEKLKEIKEAITKADVRALIVKKYIKTKPKIGQSRARARKRHEQKKKGRKRGEGKRKGKATARTPKKRVWMNKVRTQRKLLKKLRESKKLSQKDFKKLYRMSKGGFFKSKSHLKLHIDKNKMIKKRKTK